MARSWPGIKHDGLHGNVPWNLADKARHVVVFEYNISLEDLKDAGFMWNLVAIRGNDGRLMAMPSKLEGPAPRAMSKTS